LTGAEFDLLLLLVRAAGEVISRDDLAQGALGRSVAAFDRSIDNHISGLRRKLGNKVDGVERIRSVRGNGYVYSNQSRSAPE
jgi:two-component system, OmpR family, response regulator CpxR